VKPHQWKKGCFYGFFAGDVFRVNEVHAQGNVMQVFAGHVTSHRSRNESSKMRERGNRDGDKLLCNTWIAKKVNYSFLNTFGCEAFVHINKEKGTKLEAKSKKCTY